MANPSLPAALMLVLAAPAASGEDPRAAASIETAQLTIHQRIIIRVPAVPVGRQPLASPVPSPQVYVERKGPKCVALKTLAGAAITRSDSVDLVLSNGKRVRAKFGDDCQAIDFYSGFYMRPTADGKVCADRDAIHSRSGDECPIEAFQLLVAKR